MQTNRFQDHPSLSFVDWSLRGIGQVVLPLLQPGAWWGAELWMDVARDKNQRVPGLQQLACERQAKATGCAGDDGQVGRGHADGAAGGVRAGAAPSPAFWCIKKGVAH